MYLFAAGWHHAMSHSLTSIAIAAPVLGGRIGEVVRVVLNSISSPAVKAIEALALGIRRACALC
jgi:hypothetical protein